MSSVLFVHRPQTPCRRPYYTINSETNCKIKNKILNTALFSDLIILFMSKKVIFKLHLHIRTRETNWREGGDSGLRRRELTDAFMLKLFCIYIATVLPLWCNRYAFTI